MLCCERCEKHMACVKKWMLGERGLSQTCCFECPDFSECFGDNMKKRWKIIHGAECEMQRVETETGVEGNNNPLTPFIKGEFIRDGINSSGVSDAEIKTEGSN